MEIEIVSENLARSGKNLNIIIMADISAAAKILDIIRKFLYSFPSNVLFLCSIGAYLKMNKNEAAPVMVENKPANLKGNKIIMIMASP
jgi:hypothetical protein